MDFCDWIVSRFPGRRYGWIPLIDRFTIFLVAEFLVADKFGSRDFWVHEFLVADKMPEKGFVSKTDLRRIFWVVSSLRTVKAIFQCSYFFRTLFIYFLRKNSCSECSWVLQDSRYCRSSKIGFKYGNSPLFSDVVSRILRKALLIYCRPFYSIP